MSNLKQPRIMVIKQTKFNEKQIAFARQQAEAGMRIDEVCRQKGILQATFFNMKRRKMADWECLNWVPSSAWRRKLTAKK
ncbi:MAG: hypothetical protein HGA87_04745 [Desulfobulbaceae bacterium]|nr:hypothetical protein [Desulfobulbaceae bacterium]